MIISTLLLDEDDNYVYSDGLLPHRTTWDKRLLKTFIELGTVSKTGFNLLPPSLREVSTITHGEPQTPITLKEIDALSDILLVTRGRSRDLPGKKFRFTNFTRILATQSLEIWKRK